MQPFSAVRTLIPFQLSTSLGTPPRVFGRATLERPSARVLEDPVLWNAPSTATAPGLSQPDLALRRLVCDDPILMLSMAIRTLPLRVGGHSRA